MKIDPSETLLEGKWIRDCHNRVAGDDACVRIQNLTHDYLVRITTDESGWDSLYQDPADGRFWEFFYPQGELQGCGPPTLRNLTPSEVKDKYQSWRIAPDETIIEGRLFEDNLELIRK